MDRNERARQQLAMQQQYVAQVRAKLAMFAQDFATGKAAPLDRFASVIKPDDLILWHPPHDLVYQVVKVEPILNPAPGQPVGLIQITVEMTAPVQLMAGQSAMSIVVVGHQRAPGDAELNTPAGQSDNPPIPLAGPEGHDTQGEADQQRATRLDGEAAAAAANEGADPPDQE